MKSLVVYASKYGATKKIAEEIKENLNGDVEIRRADEKVKNLEQYDEIIVGGPIYMNKINKSITRFINKNKEILLKKKLGLFIGCYTAPGTEGYLEQFFPKDLMEHASAKGILGGVMQYDKMNFIYRKIFQSLKKIDDFNKNFIEPKIEKDCIKEFADIMNR